MRRGTVEVAVGVFVLVGLLCLAWISIKLGRLEIFGGRGYTVYADFPAIGGLKVGAAVEIAGVDVGRITSISLEEYQARVGMEISREVKLQEDTIASVKTKGLIGEKYVRLSPGGSERLIQPGGRIREVESPVDIEELLAKYIFGKI